MPAAGDKGVWIAYLSGEIDFYDKQTKIISSNSRNIPGLTEETAVAEMTRTELYT